MAYADLDFYHEVFLGEDMNSGDPHRWLEQASDELDALTRGRLRYAFPVVGDHAIKVKKAVCAIAESLSLIDAERRASAARVDANSASGAYRGAVTSITSGRESITYAAGGNSASFYAEAAVNSEARDALICAIASRYLAGIPDANGVNLLYGGVR